MNEETLAKLQEVMAPVAEKIGQGAEFGWMVVVKQQYVHAAIGAFWAVVGLALLAGAWYATKKLIQSDLDREGELFVFSVMGILLTVFTGGIAFIIGSLESITHLINPEYYALEFFINLVK